MPKAGSKEQIKMAATPYRQLLGSLLHICQISRGDIAGALQILSRFGKNPAIALWPLRIAASRAQWGLC